MHNHQHIGQQPFEILKKYFVFDQVFDLQNYDLNMHQLYLDLKKFRKNIFAPNYRFIFLHYETEYYLDKKYPGLTLINLQRILAALDISNYFCLVLTQQDISHHLKFLRKTESPDLTSIDSIKYQSYFYTNELLSSKLDYKIKIDSGKISKKYLCLNSRPRFHRRVVFSLLKSQGLLHDGFVSYLGKKTDQIAWSQSLDPKDNLCLLNTSTNTRVNDRWYLHDESIKQCVKDVSEELFFKNFEETEIPDAFLNLSILQNCFLHVVTETVYNYPCSFMTEKVVQPIVSKRPFVIVGPPGSIKNLKDIGFLTFDRWWDERYDQIENNEQRLLAIIEIIKSTCSMDVPSLRNICDEMRDVLEYNFRFYTTHFHSKEMEKLDQFCKQNLLPRYD